MKIAALQMVSTPDLDRNLEAAARLVARAAADGATLVALPEYFCQFGWKETDKFQIAEAEGTHRELCLAEMAGAPVYIVHLSAPRALKLAKVLQYVDEKLGRAAHPNGFELSCADNVLRPDMSLGTARAFFWKQGGDMLVHYREVPAAQGPSKEVSPSSTERGPKDDVAK
jgi:predicted amidohydrolase